MSGSRVGVCVAVRFAAQTSFVKALDRQSGLDKKCCRYDVRDMLDVEMRVRLRLAVHPSQPKET
jgi:hypothetical protein